MLHLIAIYSSIIGLYVLQFTLIYDHNNHKKITAYNLKKIKNKLENVPTAVEIV